MIYLFFATGTEEIEALATVDILRRAGLDVQLVSITGQLTVNGSHNIKVVCDAMVEDIDLSKARLLVLPGGLPGATNLAAHPLVNKAVLAHAAQGRMIAAICAAPLVLGRLGLLQGHRATCYPGFEDELAGATCTSALVEHDGQFVTGKGPAAVFEFSYKLVELLKDKATADALRDGMIWSEV